MQRIAHAHALAASGQTGEAVALLRELQWEPELHHQYLLILTSIVRLDPGDIATACRLAEALLDERDAKQALPVLQRAFRADAGNRTLLELLARAYLAGGLWEKARAVRRELIALYAAALERGEPRIRDPENYWPRLDEITFLVHAGRVDEARAAARSISARNPLEPNARMRVAVAYGAITEIAGAVNEVMAAVDLSERRDEALTCLRVGLQIAPAHPLLSALDRDLRVNGQME